MVLRTLGSVRVDVYRMPLVSCASCGRARLDDGRKAVLVVWTTRGVGAVEGLVKLSCRACGHRQTLPVRRA